MTHIRNTARILDIRAEGQDDDLTRTIKAFGTEFDVFKTKQDKRVAAMEGRVADVAGHLNDLSQKIAEGNVMGGMRSTLPASPSAALASSLTGDDGWSAIANKKTAKTSIAVASSSLIGSVQANTLRYDGGQFGVSERLPEIASGMQRRRWLREILPTLPTTGGSVEFTRELAFTNNAAPQGGNSPFEHEGVAKAESALTYEQVEKKVATIAHFIKASKQILADVGMLRQTLDTRLLYGLEIALENQILNGSGTGSNMSGLTAAGNHTAFTPASGETALDSISRAIATLQTAEAAPSVIVLHPNNFAAMRRLKASGSGEFLFGAPAGANADAVWNLPVHVTPAMTQGKFLIMDAAQMGALFIRDEASVQVGYVNDDFTKNLLVLLAELRATLAVMRPAAVVYGSLTL